MSGFPVLHLFPRVCSNSCPLNQWCHPTISSFVGRFSSCLQSFLASGSFPVNRLFVSGGQSIGTSASASVLLKDIQGWFPLGFWLVWSIAAQGTLKSFSNTTVQKHKFCCTQPSLRSNSHICIMTTAKTVGLTIRTLSAQWCVCFLMFSSFVTAFSPRSKCLLIHDCSNRPQWFWSPRKLSFSLLYYYFHSIFLICSFVVFSFFYLLQVILYYLTYSKWMLK